MEESNTHIDLGIPQGFRAGRQPMHLDRFDSPSAAATAPPQAVEPLLDCVGAAVVLGGLRAIADVLAGYSSWRHPHDGRDSESARIWSSR